MAPSSKAGQKIGWILTNAARHGVYIIAKEMTLTDVCTPGNRNVASQTNAGNRIVRNRPRPSNRPAGYRC